MSAEMAFLVLLVEVVLICGAVMLVGWR